MRIKFIIHVSCTLYIGKLMIINDNVYFKKKVEKRFTACWNLWLKLMIGVSMVERLIRTILILSCYFLDGQMRTTLKPRQRCK